MKNALPYCNLGILDSKNIILHKVKWRLFLLCSNLQFDFVPTTLWGDMRLSTHFIARQTRDAASVYNKPIMQYNNTENIIIINNNNNRRRLRLRGRSQFNPIILNAHIINKAMYRLTRRCLSIFQLAYTQYQNTITIIKKWLLVKAFYCSYGSYNKCAVWLVWQYTQKF